MQEKEPLFEYIEKMKNVVEFLAMDEELLTARNTTIFIDKNVLKEVDKFSIDEINNCDDLEENYYNELGSIRRIIEFINEGDYEELTFEGNESDYEEPTSEENEDDYEELTFE